VFVGEVVGYYLGNRTQYVEILDTSYMEVIHKKDPPGLVIMPLDEEIHNPDSL
jgi:hypothetical protein